MKKRLQALFITFVMLLGLLPQSVLADGDISVFVSISSCGELVKAADGTIMAVKKVELSGSECNIDGALKKAHSLYFSDGKVGYSTYDAGGFELIGKLWGESGSSGFGYYKNGNSAWSLEDAVEDGDYIDAFVYSPNWEGYSKFDVFSKTADENGKISLELTYVSGYDANNNYAAIISPCENAEITVDNIKTGIKTDANGKADVAIPNGTHIISASKTDESGTTVITAPVCAAKHQALFYIRDALDEEPPADGYKYFANETGATLSVGANNATAEKYEWRYKTAFDSSSSSLAGTAAETNGQSFKIPTEQNETRYYYCRVTYQKDEQEASYETFPVKASVVQAPIEPVVSKNPLSAEYTKNDDSVVPLSVKASVSDIGELSYQWLKKAEGDEEFSVIGGATESTYAPPVDSVGKTAYKCLITNTIKSTNGVTRTAETYSAEATIIVKSLLETISWTGKGTKDEPYVLSTPQDLKQLSDLVSKGETFGEKYFVFACDLTLPENWTPIGSLKEGVVFDLVKTTAKDANVFSGNIDGKNHLLTVPKGSLSLLGVCSNASLSNLSIYGEEIAGNGVCEYYIQGAGNIEINNVTLKSGTKTLKSGFIGGYAKGTDYVTIKNCTVESGVVIGYDKNQSNIGSFGGDFNGLIENCKSEADVFGTSFVGGICGSKGQSMGEYVIRECEFSGTVTASENYAGGISGHGYGGTKWGFTNNAPWATIQNCICTGKIKAANYAGGILGAEAGVKQSWENGINYIQNNYFGGTVEVSATGEGAYAGGIIGYVKSLDRYNIISGNLYGENCGVSCGIGCLAAVDSSEKYGVSDIEEGSDPKEFCEVAPKSLALTAEKLNSGLNSCGTWKIENEKLVLGDEKHITKIETDPSLAFKNGLKITKGDEFDDYSLLVYYSDGTTENVSLDLATKVNCDFSIAGNRRGEIIYNNHQYAFMLNVPNALSGGDEENGGSGSSSSSNITVSFTLLGDTVHGENGKVHTLNGGGLETWISKTDVSVSKKSTVVDVFAKVLNKQGFSWINENKKGGTSGNYIQSVTNKKGVKLSEFSNGEKSGWMYTLNGKYTLLGISEQTLADGDEIIFHFTDDYTAEEASKKWHSGSSSSSKNNSKTDSETKEDLTTETNKTENGENENNSVSFKDVENGSWYEEAVKFTAQKNIFGGTGDGNFEPDQTLTRGMLVTLLHRLENTPKAENANFEDVAQDMWYFDAVNWAKETQITTGTENGKFDPEANITRQQLAAMLFRYANHKNLVSKQPSADVLEAFADYADVSEYSKQAVAWAVEAGILNGTPEKTLNPQATATRAETAVILMRFCKLFEI